MSDADDSPYRAVIEALDQAVIEPAHWETVCERIAKLVNATGAALMPGAHAARTLAMPSTESLERAKEAYVELEVSRWDLRERGLPKMLTTGFMTDFDSIEPDQHARHPYYQEFLAPVGLRWFVGMGFKTEGGAGFGLVTIQGSDSRGPFLGEDIAKLGRIRPAVQSAVRQAELLGWRRLESSRDVLAPAGVHFLTLNWNRELTPFSEGAADAAYRAGLGAHGRLAHVTPSTDHALQAAVGLAFYNLSLGHRVCPAPIRMDGRDQSTWIADIFPTPRDFPSLAIDVAALFTLRSEAKLPGDPVETIGERHGLTQQECRLLRNLTEGCSLRQASEKMSISYETARSYLKSIFVKTNTHRQVELLKLIARGP